MNGVEIHDMHPRGYLAFDLKEILECLKEDVLARAWNIERVESTGSTADELESIRSGVSVSGQRLFDLATGITQIIWGTFSGRIPGEGTDSLIIKAIDSTLWEVFGSPACLAKIKARFHDVRPAGYIAS
jgi:hypothetical protein